MMLERYESAEQATGAAWKTPPDVVVVPCVKCGAPVYVPYKAFPCTPACACLAK